MSKRKDYDEASVIRIIERKGSVAVYPDNKVIEVSKTATDVGNGTWGKIDYLQNVHGYSVLMVNSIGKSKNITSTSGNNKRYKNDTKPKNKLNMANMTRSAMKNAAIK